MWHIIKMLKFFNMHIVVMWFALFSQKKDDLRIQVGATKQTKQSKWS